MCIMEVHDRYSPAPSCPQGSMATHFCSSWKTVSCSPSRLSTKRPSNPGSFILPHEIPNLFPLAPNTILSVLHAHHFLLSSDSISEQSKLSISSGSAQRRVPDSQDCGSWYTLLEQNLCPFWLPLGGSGCLQRPCFFTLHLQCQILSAELDNYPEFSQAW